MLYLKSYGVLITIGEQYEYWSIVFCYEEAIPDLVSFLPTVSGSGSIIGKVGYVF